MNALSFAYKLWSTYEPIIREERERENARKARRRNSSAPPPPKPEAVEPEGDTPAEQADGGRHRG